MALIITENAQVATAMSPLTVQALYEDSCLLDGYTYVSDYDVSEAGQIQVVKYLDEDPMLPEAPAGDFTDEDYNNTVMNIDIINSFRKSKKLPGYFNETMPTPNQVDTVFQVNANIVESRQATALSFLVDHVGSIQGSADEVIYELLADKEADYSIKDFVVDLRKNVRCRKARPNIVLASVEGFSRMLKYAGKEYTPVVNDELVRDARIGIYMGMLWIETAFIDMLNTDAIKALKADPATAGNYGYRYMNADYQSASTKKDAAIWTDNFKKLFDTTETSVTKTIGGSEVTIKPENLVLDFIVYDYRAFTILDRLDALRVIESENFIGQKIQAEVTSGFAVTNDKCITLGFHLGA